MSFRQKIFISYLAVFLVFTLLLYPIVVLFVKEIQEQTLRKRTQELIVDLKTVPDVRSMIESLKHKEKFLFFRVGLLNSQGEYLYDSHGQTESSTQPEITSALQKGLGYNVRVSPLFNQEMAFMAIRFDFHGTDYILQTTFPYGQIESLTRDLALTFSFFRNCGALTLQRFCLAYHPFSNSPRFSDYSSY